MTMTTIIDKKFVQDYLLNKSGKLNPRALKKYKVTSEQAYLVAHNLTSAALCKECSKPSNFLSFVKGYTDFCSKNCASASTVTLEKRKKTLVEHYGENPWQSESIQAKKKATSTKNYGVDHPSKSPDYQQQFKENCQRKYGVDHPGQLLTAINQRRNTCIEKYGVPNAAMLPSTIEKIRNTNLERYKISTQLMLESNRQKSFDERRSVDVYAKLNDVVWLSNNKDVPSTLLADQLGVAWSTILSYYKKHSIVRPSIIVSKQEHELKEFLTTYNIKYVSNERSILQGREIDIYLPDFKVGIELDGLYWHGEKYIKDRLYHVKKTQLATQAGVQLMHILDYEWANKTEIVKQRLLAKLGKSVILYARKCNIVEVSDADYSIFIKQYHIQGKAASSVRLGLLFNNELVSVMTFSKSRYNKKVQWELIRFASKGTVVGAASKLFKYFVKVYNPESIVSYADLRWNTGKLYTKLGMEFTGTTSPNYWYFKGDIFEHRSSYQKHKLSKKLSVFDESLSEWENMQANGFDRYWDCGNNIYVWKCNEK